ncbi:MAG: FISUMP domain-containing protein [Bacteroidota bacterium]
MKKISLSVILLTAGFSILSCAGEQTKTTEKQTEESKVVEPTYGSFVEPKSNKTYRTVKIGSSEWMAENLDVSTFRNGDTILRIGLDEERGWETVWSEAIRNKVPAYMYVIEKNQNNDSRYEEKKYGKIYNIHAILDPRGLAPEGWRISTESDWNNMINLFTKDEKVSTTMPLWEKNSVPVSNGNGYYNREISYSGFDALPCRLVTDFGRVNESKSVNFWVISGDLVKVADIDLNNMSIGAIIRLYTTFSCPVRCVKK